MTRLVVVSNRVPAPTAAGAQAGGLAVALESLMEQRGGLWFGWSGRVVDSPSDVPRRTESGRVQFATLDLCAAEHDQYYNEFSNSTLWCLGAAVTASNAGSHILGSLVVKSRVMGTLPS